jgi:hypothetical protein
VIHFIALTKQMRMLACAPLPMSGIFMPLTPKLWFTDREKARQQFAEDARKQRSGVLMEGLGLLELAADQPDAAIKSFGAARQFYKHSDDILRATIHEVIQLRARTRQTEALPLVRKQLELYGKAPAAEILRGVRAGNGTRTKSHTVAAPRQSDALRAC